LIEELQNLLAETVGVVRELAASPAWDHLPAGSESDLEVVAENSDASRQTGSWPWRSALMVARWALQLTAAEAEGMAAVLRVGAPAAPDVLCRAALESAALAWWLLEPDIGSRRRLARALAYRLRSAIGNELTIEYLGLSADEDRSGYGDSRDEVITEITNLALDYKCDKYGHHVHVDGERLDSYAKRVSDLVQAVWPQPGLPYAMLSQVGHAELNGIVRGLDMSPPGDFRSTADVAASFWAWHDTYLAVGAMVLSAHRAASFLGLDVETAAILKWMESSQRALRVLQPSDPENTTQTR
jgi:hypothetical protein